MKAPSAHASAASAPASLLLLGEYAVLEEGGEGLALATEPRVHARFTPWSSLVIVARFAGKELVWDEAHPESSLLLSRCVAACRSRLGDSAAAGRGDRARLQRIRVDIDGTAFFAADGSKLGLGSSAATAVALCALLLAAGGLGGDELEAALFPTALAAHRAAQGGRGSGYDVAASCWGGPGLFVGGARPRWLPLAVSALPPFVLSRGRAPVSTPAAIDRYLAWKERAPAAAADFVAASNARVEAYAAARDAPARLSLIAEAAREGGRLGSLIGVPAAPLPAGRGGAPGYEPVVKPLGAGDELFASFFPEISAVPKGSAEVKPAEGLRWE